MNTPEQLKYTKSHEWVELTEGGAKIGLTDFAQNALGSLVFVNLPETGDSLTAGEPFCDVESVKAVSDVNAPVSGAVLEINEELLDSPEKINEDPYGAWLVVLENVTDMGELLDAAAYEAFCKEEE